MLKLLKLIRQIPRYLKRSMIRKNFKKNSEFGKRLDISHTADCIADRPGLIKIGNHCRIFGKLQSQGDGEIRIGDNTCIYHKSIIGSVESVSIGCCVIISNHVHIYDNNNHPISPKIRKEMCDNDFDGDAWLWKHALSKPVIIEDNVWIGEYAAVMKGVTIGCGSIVAAHSVVTKNVPPYSVVAGNPAKVVKSLEHEE